MTMQKVGESWGGSNKPTTIKPTVDPERMLKVAELKLQKKAIEQALAQNAFQGFKEEFVDSASFVERRFLSLRLTQEIGRTDEDIAPLSTETNAQFYGFTEEQIKGVDLIAKAFQEKNTDYIKQFEVSDASAFEKAIPYGPVIHIQGVGFMEFIAKTDD